MPTFFSILPLILFTFLLLYKKQSLLKSSVFALGLTVLLVLCFWKILPQPLFISCAKGFFIAWDIFVIILGAIFFLEILRDLKIIDSLSYYLETVSKDYRVQVIILAWFFENFLEGTAGFGTPAAVVAPLLIGLGLSPISAVIVALLGNSASVVFGAAGTPIRVGFAGLNVASVPLISAWINCVGLLVPIFILYFLVKGKKDSKKQFFEALPFAIWSGVAFVLPSIAAVFIGQEFPSILGAVVGLALILLTARFGIFMPSKVRRLKTATKPKNIIGPFKVFTPYVLLIILLIAGKIIFGNLSFIIPFGINHKINLFNPGLSFMATGIILAVVWRVKKAIMIDSVQVAIKRTVEPFLVIVCMSAMVQLMTSSGQNTSGLPSSIALIAKNFENILLPFVAPFIGAFGSFVTGSATISNIMFGNFISIASTAMNFDVSKILALSVVGAAAGNMIALADILSAEAVVGLKNNERHVLRGVIVPCLIYLFLLGIIGVFISF
ncbi:MAG: L-lactate permease [bacterium]